jgi:hypothetical protein
MIATGILSLALTAGCSAAQDETGIEAVAVAVAAAARMESSRNLRRVMLDMV